MTTNIYWCQEKDEFYGAFFVAPTRGRAKVLCASYFEGLKHYSEQIREDLVGEK